MARTFNPGTLRYAVSEAMSDGANLTFEQLMTVAQAASEKATNGNVKSAMRGLSAAGLAEFNHANATWSLTEAGFARWDSEHPDPNAAQASAPGTHLLPPLTDPALLVRNVSRAAVPTSPADRLPFTPRVGSMDFAEHPRISGPWRIWPDGRRERIDQPTNQEQTV